MNTLPKIYLAGKIRKNCWRHDLVSGLRDHHWNFGQLQQATFVYVGPFFVGCDHGCYHNTKSHGNGIGCSPDNDNYRSEVVRLCYEALQKTDLLFCYIDALDCYGTIAEIGYARALGIRIVIAFAPCIDRAKADDFWFPCTGSLDVHYNVCKCELPSLLHNTVKGLK